MAARWEAAPGGRAVAGVVTAAVNEMAVSADIRRHLESHGS